MEEKMKKSVKLAAIVTAIINVVGLVTNLICANAIGKAPFSMYMAGGDCVEYIGFGINLLKVFYMTNTGGGGVENHVSFSIKSLLLSLVSVFVVVLAIITIIMKIKNSKAKEA